MAFNLSERFPIATKTYRCLDPGLYQNTNSLLIKPNKVPFLSRTPRNTQTCVKIWTHAVYYGDIRPKVPNCTTISSKKPRFAYENIKNENVRPLVCQCGIQHTCECSIEKEKTVQQDEIICHTAVRRRLFKGPTLRSVVGKGILTPSRKDYKFKILPGGSKIDMLKWVKEDSPQFYDTRVVESNAFYRGCKWSKWTSQRNNVTTTMNLIPGPADYKINVIQSSHDVICAEKLRAIKRKTSKQLRFIEKIQRQNFFEALPGPASYTPILPKGTNLKFVGSRAKRFISPKRDETPKPTTYFIKRDFDVNNAHFKPCLANLPSRAPFAVKALRFKYRGEEGPSPTSYNLNNISYQLKHRNVAPFGFCSKRFTDSYEKNTQNDDDSIMKIDTVKKHHPCAKHLPTWQFRSKTNRIKPIIKMINEHRSADLPFSKGSTVKRSIQFQKICPFFSSEARFHNWFNWISVQGQEKTPGPAYYNIEKGKCLPAVRSGPTNRSERFIFHASQKPAPNAYEVKSGLESILTTYNQRLKNNVKNTHKYIWKAPPEQRKLSLNEQDIMLLNKSIALLDLPDIFEYTKYENKKNAPSLMESKTRQQKMLRCFVYAKKVKHYF